MSNLLSAHYQWNNRPEDERFASLAALREYCVSKRRLARMADDVDMQELQFVLESEELRLEGSEGVRTALTPWAFEQVASKSKTMPTSVEDLPTKMVREILNFRLDKYRSDLTPAAMLFHTDPKAPLLCRAFTSPRYTRVWDYEIVDKVMTLKGWKVPPAMDRTFSGKTVSSSGLYAGDRDMFIFMVNEDNRIDDGSPDGLARGFFFSNSEVGAKSAAIRRFLYKFVCGNHIVWGAEQVEDFSVRHVGDAGTRIMDIFQKELADYQHRSPKELEAAIKKAKQHVLGKTESEVEDNLFGQRDIGLPRKTIRAALQAAQLFQDVEALNPLSAWGFVQGLTQMSQLEPVASKRVALDTAGDRILKSAA